MDTTITRNALGQRIGREHSVNPVSRCIFTRVPFLFLALAAGCRASGGRVPEEALDTWQRDHVALQIPKAAKVTAEPERLRVDSADGSRWFDIAWVDADPEIEARLWMNATCPGMRWDEPYLASNGVQSMGGWCTIERKGYWAIVTIEPYEQRYLLTCYLADSDRLTLEDAWIDFVRTAQSVNQGSAPRAQPAPAELQASVRKAATDRQLSGIAVPGGGILSQQISQVLAPNWLDSSPPPRHFSQQIEPATPAP